jgi:SAM-dependent methyltransferase
LNAPAFDALAADYDAAFSETPLGSALRSLVWSRLDVVFRDAQRILDLGCGTGEDALHLAGLGKQVLAMDASSAMVHRARQKAQVRGIGTRLQFQCLAMQDLHEAATGARFDGALSNFGALNCVEDLPSLVAALSARLLPGARLLFVPMGRYVPWEWAWYLVHGKPHKAWRRLRRERLQWRGLTLGYPTPKQITAVLSPYFHIDRVRPLGFALPPSYAGEWLNRSPRLFAVLNRLERAGQRWPLLACCSDHYIVEATRRGS